MHYDYHRYMITYQALKKSTYDNYKENSSWFLFNLLNISLIDAIHKAMHGDELYNFGSKHIKRFLCLN